MYKFFFVYLAKISCEYPTLDFCMQVILYYRYYFISSDWSISIICVFLTQF